MTPAERRKRELDRIFQAGWNAAADAEPLTAEERTWAAFLLAPTLAALPRTPKARPLSAAA